MKKRTVARDFFYHITLIIENQCFLRAPFQNRKKLKPGKSFCRVTKGYFESAFRILLGNNIRKVEIGFIENDKVNNVCVEKLEFVL